MGLREKTCCFTGHRALPTGFDAELKDRTKRVIAWLLASGVRYFGAGGARGYDAVAAESVLEIRAVRPQVKLILVLPCPEQAAKWRLQDVERYNRIKAAADKVVYVSDHYTPDCMFRRNRHLVECSSWCVAYCTRSTGGTAYTVSYARQQGLQIICP